MFISVVGVLPSLLSLLLFLLLLLLLFFSPPRAKAKYCFVVSFGGSHVYGSGTEADPFMTGLPNYGKNEKFPSGVPPGKYQELMHSLLYERALRQSRAAVIDALRDQLEDYRKQVKNMKKFIEDNGNRADGWHEHRAVIGERVDTGWVDGQAQIDRWVIYFVIIYSCHVIWYHLISFNMMCQVDREQVKQRIVDIPRCPGPDPNPNP